MFLSLALCLPQSSATERALSEPATALDFNSPDWLIALLTYTAESLDCADDSHKPEETRHHSRAASRDHQHQGMLERFLTYVMFRSNKEEGSVTLEHLHTDMTRIHSFQMFSLFKSI